MTIPCELTLYKIPNRQYVSVGIVGNLREVGCWNTNCITRSHASSDGLHHVRVYLPPETRLEYKWILFNGVDEYVWEDGPNKVVDLPSYGTCYIMNAWGEPAVVDTHLPDRSPSMRRSMRIETEWKVGTQGTVYKNPEPITYITPTPGNITMFSGTKLPRGENFVYKKAQSSPTEASVKRRKLGVTFDKTTSGSNSPPKCKPLLGKETCAVNNGSCGCSGTSCNNVSSASTADYELGSDDADDSASSSILPELIDRVRTLGSSCYNRLSDSTSDLTTQERYTRLAVMTGVVCFLAYGGYKATHH
ncbi:hypothetical protein ACF0H5_003913 [Mactra antiquata]